MTSITSSSTTMLSPAERLQATLQTAVSNGAVKAADQSALSGAITDIDAAMKSSGPPAIGTDPSTMKDKVSSLIDQEVSDGKLTTDQATELKQVFAQAAPQGQVHGHHHGHGGGLEKLLASLTDSSSSNGTSSTATTSTTVATSPSNPLDQLVGVLKQLEQKIAGNATYSAAGTASTGTASASSSNLVSMLVNGLA